MVTELESGYQVYFVREQQKGALWYQSSFRSIIVAGITRSNTWDKPAWICVFKCVHEETNPTQYCANVSWFEYLTQDATIERS